MRIAILSDIHGNRTAFEAVLKDLKYASPDIILHGGDLADSGSSPVEIVDRIRGLGWHGVVRNTDELLFRPAALHEFARTSTAPAHLFAVIEEVASVTRQSLGEERLSWMRTLPRVHIEGPLAVLHASPASLWHAPARETKDAEMESTYATISRALVVFGHTHQPSLHAAGGRVFANSGSVGLSYDGDQRAAYLLVDNGQPIIRRVNYDVEREVKLLEDNGLPHSDWIAAMLRTARPAMPR